LFEGKAQGEKIAECTEKREHLFSTKKHTAIGQALTFGRDDKKKGGCGQQFSASSVKYWIYVY
jgi:hypothetical protein